MAAGKVFLSSTFKELMAFRSAAYDAIRAAGHECVLMENIASADPPQIACAREVQSCDLFVLLLGVSYGSSPEDDKQLSYTELEFRASLGKKIPKLVFAGDPKEYVVPSGVVEDMARHGLPDQVQRVEQLRQSAVAGCTPTFFSTIADLRAKVQDCVERHFQAHPPAGASTTEDPLGELVPFLCDRRAQDTDFRVHLDTASKRCPRSPLIYVLHGPADQRHENCVRALVWRHVEKERAGSGVMFQPVPLQRSFVDWPEPDTLVTSMYKRLIGRLLLTVDQDADLSQLDAERFCQVAAGKSVPYLVLRHPIRSWDSRTEQLIRTKYLPFWDDVAEYSASGKGKSLPRLLIFFEIRYDRGPGGEPPEPLLASIHKVFQSARRKLEASDSAKRCVTEVLQPLPDVAESDYQIWVSRYADVLPVSLRNLNFTQEFGGPHVPMEKFEKTVQTLLGRSY